MIWYRLPLMWNVGLLWITLHTWHGKALPWVMTWWINLINSLYIRNMNCLHSKLLKSLLWNLVLYIMVTEYFFKMLINFVYTKHNIFIQRAIILFRVHDWFYYPRCIKSKYMCVATLLKTLKSDHISHRFVFNLALPRINRLNRISLWSNRLK